MERRLIAADSGGVAVSHYAPASAIPGLPLLVGHSNVSAAGQQGEIEFLNLTMAMLCGRPGVEAIWTRSH